MYVFPFDNIAESTKLIATAVALGVDYYLDINDDFGDDKSGTFFADIETQEEYDSFFDVTIGV